MSAHAHQLGVKLRPHVKTHKTLQAAHYQVRDHFGGITVSTLAEAEFYAQHGFQDITYAVPLTPSKISRALQLAGMINNFHILIDHEFMVDKLAEQCARQQQKLSVLIKIDCGYGRAGLSPHDVNLVPLAHLITQEPWLNFEGILTHAGHAYDCVNFSEIKTVADQEYQAIITARDILQAHNIQVNTVSLGSTPTATAFEHIPGVTEMRPGNYALFDLFQASIGSCSPSDIALSVISEVIAFYPQRQDILIDAGALAMSKDQGATHLSSSIEFGRICDLNYQTIPHCSLVGLSQEHGKIKTSSNFDFDQIQVGTRVRIIPNHSCLVTALYDQLYVVDGLQVIDQWSPVRGW